MSATTHMNIFSGQGNTINEVHKVKKQNLEINQQCIPQNSEEKKREDKTKVQKFEAKKRIEIKNEKDGKKDQKINKKKSNPEKQKDNPNLSEGKLVDIRV